MGEEKKNDEIKGGELLFCGPTNWNIVGQKIYKNHNRIHQDNLLSPTRLRPLIGIDIRYVASGCVSCHCVALDVDGRCYTWGRNKKGQLGHGDTLQRDRPTVVSELSKYKVVTASAGQSHTVVVTDDGQSFAFGWNKHGQLGSGSLNKEVETSPVTCQVSDVTTVACGGDFTMWLSSAQGASILSAGLPQYGQLGHGTDNEFNTKSSSVCLAYEPQSRPKAISSLSGETIVKVACGTNHTVAVDSNGFVYTWGYGGYGRLGHREQKDEFVPRRVDVFTRRNMLPSDAVVSAGDANSACTGPDGQLYMWGKIKNKGDEWMYPKPLMDLSGWNLRCMDSGHMFHFVGAESSCISWGQALNGELGYGPNAQKSSANPKKVDILEGMHVMSVACGYVHSLVVVDRTDVIDRLEQLDVYDGKATEKATEISKPVTTAKKISMKGSADKSRKISEPVTTAKKTSTNGSADNSRKRKKSKEASSEEEDKDDQRTDNGGDNDEATNGNLEKQRGGKSGGRGRGRGRASNKSPGEAKSSGRGHGRPKGSADKSRKNSELVTTAKKTSMNGVADNSRKQKMSKEASSEEEDKDDQGSDNGGDNGIEEEATNGNLEKKQRGGKVGNRGRGRGRASNKSPGEAKSNGQGHGRPKGSRGRPRN